MAFLAAVPELIVLWAIFRVVLWWGLWAVLRTVLRTVLQAVLVDELGLGSGAEVEVKKDGQSQKQKTRRYEGEHEKEERSGGGAEADLECLSDSRLFSRGSRQPKYVVGAGGGMGQLGPRYPSAHS